MCWFAFRNRRETFLARSGQVHAVAARLVTFDKQATFGGTADIIRVSGNRPLLTLNGHPGAVRRTTAPSPMQSFGR